MMEASYISTNVNTEYLPNILNLFEILRYLNIIFLELIAVKTL